MYGWKIKVCLLEWHYFQKCELYLQLYMRAGDITVMQIYGSWRSNLSDLPEESCIIAFTALKINMEPRKSPNLKENRLPNLHCWVLSWFIFQDVMTWKHVFQWHRIWWWVGIMLPSQHVEILKPVNFGCFLGDLGCWKMIPDMISKQLVAEMDVFLWPWIFPQEYGFEV